ncbi:MAG: MoxR family ATPase [Lachnospiraceae bacterium]|nr:MoxR family ATPase [Lachnospiraceae bacterium]MBQ6482764.1 MoxR family ATPase [Anaerolineaceae bacterium]
MNGKLSLLKANIGRRLIGKDELIDLVLTALLAGGHLLLEDVPGVGKTTLARALADSIEAGFSRIQCTPDTMPGDITGVTVYHMEKGVFETIPGPVVNQIVLADELNRATPKTQAALLEAMEERQVTIDGKTIPIPEPFLVIGTENPMEMAGTYPLPEAQLDRFMMKLSVGYPSSEEALRMADEYLSGTLHEPTQAVLSAQDILEMKREVRQVGVHEDLRIYARDLIEETRTRSEVRFGASPRALLELLRASQACAYLEGRDYCVPEDIRRMCRVTLPHRLILTADARMNRTSPEQVVREILEHIRVPQ